MKDFKKMFDNCCAFGNQMLNSGNHICDYVEVLPLVVTAETPSNSLAPSLIEEPAITHRRTHHIKIRQIIFNDPAVIIITENGEKFVSKAHNEAFDKEKGLLMCLAKMNGISHRDLNRMIKSAKTCGSKKPKE